MGPRAGKGSALWSISYGTVRSSAQGCWLRWGCRLFLWFADSSRSHRACGGAQLTGEGRLGNVVWEKNIQRPLSVLTAVAAPCVIVATSLLADIAWMGTGAGIRCTGLPRTAP